MDKWCAFPKKDLMMELFMAEQVLDTKEDKLWSQIKISPEIWTCNDVFTENFWVVAKYKNWVIWYNDIEEGFNLSKYKNEGEIIEYGASQQELNFAIRELQSK